MCERTLWGGAIDIYETKNGPGILLSTSDVVRSNDEDITKEKDKRAQENSSLYHKILYFDFKNQKLEIFQKDTEIQDQFLLMRI